MVKKLINEIIQKISLGSFKEVLIQPGAFRH